MTHTILSDLRYHITSVKFVKNTFDLVVSDGCILQLIIRLDLSDLLSLKSSDLDLDLIASTVLGLDVLRGTEALESTLDHDAHLCAESLSLLHRVGGDDD